MTKHKKPPAWVALLFLAAGMLFVLNIDLFRRLITPHVGAQIQRTQNRMQDAAKKK